MRKALLAAAVSGLLFPAFAREASAACDTLKTVRAAGGDYTDIQAALDDIPSVLTGDYCVDIQDDGPYNEFYVREKDANGHHITIGALDGTHKPTIVASGGYVGTLVSVESSSVTIISIGVYDAPIEAIYVSSSYVTLDGVYARFSAPDQVSDGAFALSGDWTTVIRSSADVTGGRGVALKMTGTGTTVSYSTFTSDSQDVVRFGSEIRPSVDYVSGSTNTVTHCRIVTTGTNGVHFGPNSTGNTLSDSTVTVNACHLCFGALLSNGADNSVLSGDYIENGISADTVRSFTLRSSSVIVTGSGDPALALGNSPDFSIVSSVLYSTAAAGAALNSVSGTISYSTITSDGAFGGWALTATDAHPLTITRSYVRGPGGIDIDGSITEGMTLSNSVVVSTEIAGIAIQEINGSIFTLSTVTSGGALSWDGSGQAVVRNLLFKGFPSDDLTAFSLPDAVVTATFTGVGFEDPKIGLNVDASGLSPGNLAATRLTMRDAYGPESGPARENDPGHVVDWVGVALSTPSRPAAPVASTMTLRSILWSWPAVPNAWTYGVYDAATLAPLASVETTYYLEAALTPGHPYGLSISAVNGAGESALSPSATAYTLARPFPCDTTKVVRLDGGGDYTSIQAAIDAIPAVLTDDYCLDIKDNGPYNEFNVQNVDANGHQLTIGSLDGSFKPAVVASNGYQGTVIYVVSSSVTLMNMAVYGGFIESINISTSYVTLDGIYTQFHASDQVSDAAFALTGGWTTLIRSSADVIGGQGVALKIAGSGTTVSLSTFTSDAPDVVSFGNSIRPAVEYVKATTNTVTQCRIVGAGINGVNWGSNSVSNTVSKSTIIAGADAAVVSGGAHRAVLDGDSLQGAITLLDASSFTLRSSTVIVPSGANAAMTLVNSPGFIIDRSFVGSAGGDGINALSSSGTITYSTFSAPAAGFWGGNLTSVHPLTVSRSYFGGAGGLSLNLGDVEGLTMSDSLVVSTSPAGSALQLEGNTNFSLSTVTSRGSLNWDGTGAADVYNLMFKGFPAPGMTAMQMTNNSYIATFTRVGFLDPTLAANIDSTQNITPGARLTLKDAYGPRSGPGYEIDPAGLVDWTGVAISSPARPGAPVASTSTITSSSILWTWPGVANFWSYNVYDAASHALIASVGTSSYLDTPLAPGRPYGVAISAVNGDGESALSPSATAYTSAGTPPALAFNTVGVTSVTLSWSTAGNPAGTRYLLGHWVIKGSTTVATITQAGTGVSTGAVVTGLLPNTTYHFNLRAENKLKKITPYDVSVETFTTTLAAKPGSIASLKAVAVDAAHVTWTWAPMLGAHEADSYLVLGCAGGVSEEVSASSTVAISSPNASACLRVAARNTVGLGPLTAAVTGYSLAAAPSGLTVEAVNVTSVTLSWSTAGNPAGTRYVLGHWVIKGSTGTMTISQTGTGISTGAAVTGLLPNTTYHFNVRAENKLSKITPYDPLVETLTKTDASKPAAIAGLKAAGADAGSVQFTWTAQASGAAEADAYLFSPSTGGVFQTASNSFTLYTAAPNSPVSGKVRASNVTGLGALSAAVTGYSLAAAPTGLSAMKVDVASVTVTWNVNGNPDGTKYLLSRWVAGGSTSTVIVAKTAAEIASGIPFLGLAANTTYQFNVRAENNQLAATAYDPAVEIQVKTRHSASVAALATIVPVRGWPYSGRTLKLAPAGPSSFRAGTTKSVALKTGTSITTNGTVLAVSLPPSISGAGRMRIYTKAAVLVQDLDLGELKGGFDYYLDWDGLGQDGAEAAPGAYYAILTIAGAKQNASLKLAVAPPPKKSPAIPR